MAVRLSLDEKDVSALSCPAETFQAIESRLRPTFPSKFVRILVGAAIAHGDFSAAFIEVWNPYPWLPYEHVVEADSL